MQSCALTDDADVCSKRLYPPLALPLASKDTSARELPFHWRNLAAADCSLGRYGHELWEHCFKEAAAIG